MHCATVIDAYSRCVIGWTSAGHVPSELSVDNLEMARWQRHGAVVHFEERQRLHVVNLRAPPAPGRPCSCSMGRVASSVDNALIESFWSTVQREPLHRRD